MDNSAKINEIGRLYSLREAIIDFLKNLELSHEMDSDKRDISSMKSYLQYYNEQVASIENKVADLRKDFCQFSVEELYSMYGRYDKFISVEFHPNSESYKEFGKLIMGVLIYNRREREDLNKALHLKNIPRTNGYVKINPSELSDLKEQQVKILESKGFLSGDVFEISSTGIEPNDRYLDSSKKTIPGTFNIQIDHTGFHAELVALKLFEDRIANNDKPLIEAERDEYYAYKLLFKKSQITESEWNDHIYETNSKIIKERIRHYMLHSKINRDIRLSKNEKKDLKYLFEKRMNERSKLINKEINRASNKKLREIIQENADVVSELYIIGVFFEEENLSPYGAKHSVYLDFERFSHIFIRHFEKFQIGDWKRGKKSFQYNFKDTKRLLEIIIEELQPKIDEAIDTGNELNLFDKNAYYFNGNYYLVHIDKTGRLLSFFPYLNK